MISIARRAATSWSSARSASRTAALVPSAASETCRGSCAAATLNARAIVDEQLGQPDRLFQEVERADLGGVDRGLDRAVPGHHHHRHRQQSVARPLAQQRHAVGVGHPDVEQHERRLRALAIGARFAGVLRRGHAIAFVLEDFRQQFANADFVVDDEYFPQECHVPFRQAAAAAGFAAGRAGKCRVTRAPVGCTLSSTTRPPCSSMIFFTIASPRPVPFALVVTYGSNACASTSSAKPGPPSAKVSVASPPFA